MDRRSLFGRDFLQQVTGEMGLAALPHGPLKLFADRFDQAAVAVGHHQIHALKPPALELAEERCPGLIAFPIPGLETQNRKRQTKGRLPKQSAAVYNQRY